MNKTKESSSQSRREFINKVSSAAAIGSLSVINSPGSPALSPGFLSQDDSPGNQSPKPRLNCAETVLTRANELYGLELTAENIAFAATFGGGMGIGDKCGTVTGSMMVLGYLFRPETGSDSPARQISVDFLKEFKETLLSLDCRDLKQTHRTESEGCEPVISAAMDLLGRTIEDNHSKRVR